MIVASESNYLSRILNARDDEPSRLGSETQQANSSDKTGRHELYYDVFYKSPEHHEEHADGQKALKTSDENLETAWRNDLTHPEEYSAHCNKFIPMLKRF